MIIANLVLCTCFCLQKLGRLRKVNKKCERNFWTSLLDSYVSKDCLYVEASIFWLLGNWIAQQTNIQFKTHGFPSIRPFVLCQAGATTPRALPPKGPGNCKGVDWRSMVLLYHPQKGGLYRSACLLSVCLSVVCCSHSLRLGMSGLRPWPKQFSA